MDRVSKLANELSSVLDELQDEAAQSNARELMAPLAWLDEANGWLRFELDRRRDPRVREPVPFSYMPVDSRH